MLAGAKIGHSAGWNQPEASEVCVLIPAPAAVGSVAEDVLTLFAESDQIAAQAKSEIHQRVPDAAGAAHTGAEFLQLSDPPGRAAGNHPVAAMFDYVADDLAHGGPGCIVERDHATHVQQVIDVKELRKRVIEGVPAVDECELHPGSALQQTRQQAVRRKLSEVHQIPIPGISYILQSDVVPHRLLLRVADNVPPCLNLGERIAEEQRGNAVGETYFDTGFRPDREDEALKLRALLGSDTRLDGVTLSSIIGYRVCREYVAQSCVHK